MSDYIVELQTELAGHGNEPLTAGELSRALLAVAQAFEAIEAHRKTLTETVQFVNALQERLLLLDDLPVDAPLGALIRIRNGTLGQRATLYMGNGTGQPITKLPVPVAV